MAYKQKPYSGFVGPKKKKFKDTKVGKFLGVGQGDKRKAKRAKKKADKNWIEDIRDKDDRFTTSSNYDEID